ncbi:MULTISPECIES: MerR family transcriptional regulator [Halomonadaceae]|uniref:MerR family transcriptional regulator n=5 Tax=Vreelandella TaxID=3137766 RepID=A0A3S0Z1V4_9GAMM|nr:MULTISPECIES: helix-turn-helix domain-containing protein [Halomonas]AJY53027.1 transcriptional regulator, MerR family [Halomonas sp. KO116]MCH4813569.1 helix-turn-helix domain-containing protein [Halomonas neptunia]NVF16045.1 helix-turn-helix domain-containing protein [Halomonas maris]NYS79406.1 helix-turn-helix domain-containing protein [Halomonas glaciei]RUR34907.1 MerR family transcriptional regulator [Halomonas nanhaiensis]
MPLRRGELARRAGCNIETVRYYERIGLMPNPPRSENGFRSYEERHLTRLTFIRRARELGFTLEEVQDLLRLVDGGHYTCAQVQELALRHTDDIQRKINDLHRMQRALKEMSAQCSGEEVPKCPIIEILSETS